MKKLALFLAMALLLAAALPVEALAASKTSGSFGELRWKLDKKGTLTAQQIADLERIGMRWEVFAEHWQEMYDEAKAYSEANGNLKVPRGYQTSNGYNLNLWLSKMKREQDRLSDGQITALTAIGMKWPAAARQEAVR